MAVAVKINDQPGNKVSFILLEEVRWPRNVSWTWPSSGTTTGMKNILSAGTNKLLTMISHDVSIFVPRSLFPNM